jgi:hypothetical protein
MPAREKSPTEVLITSMHTGLEDRWNRARFIRLSNWLFPNERDAKRCLGALVGLPGNRMAQYERSNRFPLPVCIHLQMLETTLPLVALARSPSIPPLLTCSDLRSPHNGFP